MLSECHSHTLPAQQLTRQQRSCDHTAQTNATRKIQYRVDPSPTTTCIQMLRNQRTHDAKQSSPKTRNAACCPSDWCGECLGRPPIKHSVEHALEEILHDVESNVGGRTVDGTEEEDGNAHHGGGNDHGPFAADAGDAVGCGAEKNADDTGEVYVDVGTVGVPQGEVQFSVFGGEDFGEEGA
jgi:hypothetical protein